MNRTREQTEDFFHDVIALMLPGIQKSNIRPAFQKTKRNNPVAENYISQDGIGSGLKGFDNKSDFVYFRVRQDNGNDQEPEIDAGDNATFLQEIELTVYIYGVHSQTNAVILKSLMRTNRIQTYLNGNGYYQTEEDSITPLTEEINGEWWDRVDVTFHFMCKIEIVNALEDSIEIAKGYNTGLPTPNIILDGKERK